MNVLQTSRTVEQIAASVFDRIAPIWPLDSFVAVNPFWGYIDQPFTSAMGQMQRSMGWSMYMPQDYYAELIRSGAITEGDVRTAVQRSGGAGRTMPLDSSTSVLDAILGGGHAGTQAETDAASDCPPRGFPHTMLDRLPVELRKTIEEHIALWCSSYFDRGQAAWDMMDHSVRFFSAWRKLAALDRMADIAGLKGCRSVIMALPKTPEQTIERAVTEMGVPESILTDYFRRLLFDHVGWASHLRLYSWQRAVPPQDNPLFDLLAVRMAYEIAAFEFLRRHGTLVHWGPSAEEALPSASDVLPLALAAHEFAYERQLLTAIGSRPDAISDDEIKGGRPAAQCVFCIDVRSERMRRALEAVAPDVITIGFAGFFGFPIHYTQLGDEQTTAQYPVLLSSQYHVGETLGDESASSIRYAADQRSRRQFSAGWSQLTAYGASSLTFVELLGLGYGWKLIRDGLIQPSDVNAPTTRPEITPHRDSPDAARGHMHFSLEDQVNLACGALKNMGITQQLARLVLLCGHGAQTTNNPYQASLDCGACGGHAGGPNARVAAAVLNRPEVRARLNADGIEIPSDTWFVAGEHNTTTDEVTIFDLDLIPETHRAEVEQLRHQLTTAGERVRREKAALEGEAPSTGGAELQRAAKTRAADWAQIRPEWGLAGNAAFIAAPRLFTRGLDLDGRTFLHDYDWRHDQDNAILTLIMTAPMVVAHWINMQYYASTVCPERFGSGTKTLHNVVGIHGVCLGNAGDLQIGLPMESLHDGNRWRHDPLRLLAIIAAPKSAISKVIQQNSTVRMLLDNHWLHLIAIDPTADNHFFRYRTGNQWMAI